ncbi:hypothetical protein [Nocardia kruczakiae]|uniref:hypothetical protein n=1 Tax=Nocardia kruczakiae TaxID=261477 RepID=UPI0007A52817|nr:hypothetical protein [Nocardia kruczakiae]
MSFLALGFLRTEVSRLHQEWDAAQIRCVARRLGYKLSETVAFGDRTDNPVQFLIGAAITHDAEAVIVPSLDHFPDGIVPAELVEVTDVITVRPERTYARWPLGEPPGANGAN